MPIATSGFNNGTLMMGCRMRHSVATRVSDFNPVPDDRSTCYLVDTSSGNLSATLGTFKDGVELRFFNNGNNKLTVFGTFPGKTKIVIGKNGYAIIVFQIDTWYPFCNY